MKTILKILTVFLALSIVSCGEDPNSIGLNILNKNTFGTDFTDTLSVYAHSVLHDSVLTSSITDANGIMLGSIYDATMGKTTSNIAMPFWLSSLSPEFGANPVVDSVVLSVAYTSYFGNIDCYNTFRFYELEEVLYKDSLHYSNYRAQHSNYEIASKTFMPNFDSTYVDGDYVSPSIKVRLDNYYGERLFNLSDTAMTSQTEFVKEYNGFYIAPDPINTPNTGFFLQLDLTNSQTYLAVYYHNDVADTLFTYKLSIDTDTPRFVEYEHYGYEDASSEFKAQVLEGDTTLGENKLYLQSMAGVMVKLEIPFIESFKQLGTVGISDAKIYFNADNNDAYFGIASDYELVREGDDGVLYTIADYAEGSSFYGGSASDNGTICFRITRHLQGVLGGSYDNPNLYLLVRNSSYLPCRSVIHGWNPVDMEKRVKIEMTYSTIE